MSIIFTLVVIYIFIFPFLLLALTFPFTTMKNKRKHEEEYSNLKAIPSSFLTTKHLTMVSLERATFFCELIFANLYILES